MAIPAPPKKPPLRIMVVAESPQQRMAFSDTIRGWGLDLVDCLAVEQLTDKHFKHPVDVWLIDSQNDYDIIDSIDKKIPTHSEKVVLLGFNNAPFLNESQLYAKWQRKLKRKLAQALHLPDMIEKADEQASAVKAWQYVVMLGASMGGPLAIKEFLDHLPADLPIALVLAQHFNANMMNTLPRIISRHNHWRCEVMTLTQQLQSGRCLIVPIEQSVVCDSNGRVILQKNVWQGDYRPSISQLFKNGSEVFGNRLISIMFSGMGNDGSDVAEIVQRNDSLIWSQSPASCTCPSQPQSFIDTGKVSFIGDPKQLAEHLTLYVKKNRHSSLT